MPFIFIESNHLLNHTKYIVELTESDIKNEKVRFTKCGRDFFPSDSFGGASKQDLGKPISVFIEPLNRMICTDLPLSSNGNPRWFFRDRSWVGELIKQYKIGIGSKICIERRSDRDYIVDVLGGKYRIIDLFAGIGGIRRAFESVNCNCVFSSEWDKFARETYSANYMEVPSGDITKIDASDIPNHDILTGGFPCQPFSIAGVSKKKSLGKKHGFADETQGTLFFDVCRILEAKRPKAFLLENVRNLKSHDGGNTFKIIKENLEALGYTVVDKVINGKLVVPQNRQRIYIVGFRDGTEFEFPSDEEISNYRLAATLGDILDSKVPDKYTLTDHLWTYLKNYKEKHRKAGNGFGFGLVDKNDVTRTLSARYYKDGSEILVKQKGKNPRRLTPRECARLMGFDSPGKSEFQIPVSDTQAYRQFGNSVVMPVVKAIAKKIVATLNNEYCI